MIKELAADGRIGKEVKEVQRQKEQLERVKSNVEGSCEDGRIGSAERQTGPEKVFKEK